MLNDLRYAQRSLRQSPGFALTAIISIGLGIGANAAIFSFQDALLFRPLPVPNPSQVVSVRPTAPTEAFADSLFEGVSYPDFVDFRKRSQSFDGLVAETYEDPAGMAGPIQEMVRSFAPAVPIFRIQTMDDLYYRRSVQILRLLNGIFASAGGIGLALALIGLYAVVAYQVGRRTREIGIRMALGAPQSSVMNMIMKQAAILAIVGVTIGAIVSTVAAQPVSTALEVRVFDPVVFGSLAVALFGTTLLAAAIPARRATRIDPQQALRQE